jgi:hypothetical protein
MLNLLDRLGNLNPQLFRELKGRLTWQSFLAVISLSIVAQLLFFLYFYSQLPTADNYRDSTYCLHAVNGVVTSRCYQEIVSPNSFAVNWSLWWQHIERTLNLSIPFLLMVPGTYFLLSDLQNEERQGTLDFVRLSPQSASSVLLGKILGVPILVYCAIVSLLPFHTFALLKAGNSLKSLLSFYTMMVAGAFLIFSFTLLFGFFSKSMLKRSAPALGVTIVYVLLVAAIFVPGYLIWNTETVWRTLSNNQTWSYFATESTTFWAWFGLRISENLTIAHVFTLVNIAILTAWIWQSLSRSFHQPNVTLLRKRQSYGLVLYLQVLLLGMHIQDAKSNFPSDLTGIAGVVLLPILLNLPVFLLLIAVLSPQRQAVMDWARYRQTQSPRSSLLKDLLFHDQSPAGLSIAVNLAIAGVLWLIAISLQPEWARYGYMMRMMVGLGLITIAIYASVVQWIVIQKTRKRNFIAAVMIVMLILIPPAFVTLLSFSGLIATTLKESVILASPFLWMLTGQLSSNSVSVWGALLGQLSLIVGINALIARQVYQLGTSDMKALQPTRLKPQS